MHYLTQWVSNIIVFILLAMIVDMLMPDSSMKKYTKMVTGLLLIAIILTPIVKLTSENMDNMFAALSSANGINDGEMKSSIEMKKVEIEKTQHAYILEQMAVQLKKEANGELVDQYQKSIQTIKVEMKSGAETSMDPNNIEKVIVSLKDADDQKVIPAVKPIVINPEKPVQTQTNTEDKNIISLLSNCWNISRNQIQLQSEGGVPASNE
ncbi:stage III sporulation protein AF [Heyndrickxia acidicola]|uniref:Stage III sporulation protein AF n=1 Tax=Heyndrickxia acidicola TaxID=209389 RepID=A0ABU6MPL8_9BACI|nr:stage III sporulation protein AF [Heyndrickxia acidicola]MED1205172.1 stage III sporulation protein AF [Heyndrickxia acidicola]